MYALDINSKLKISARTLVALSPLISLISWSTYRNRWGHLFSDWHEIRYTDLRPITSNLSCFLADPAWTINGPSCDPWQRPLNYPSIWLTIFRYLGLDDQNVLLAGILVSIMVVFGFAVLLSVLNQSFSFLLLGVALSVSPPVFFVIERGNVDGIIFFILVMASVLLASNSAAQRLSGSALIALGGVLKVFPIGSLLAILFWRFTSKKTLIFRFGFTGLISALVALPLLPQAERMFSGTPSFPAMQFGIRTLPIEIFECLPTNKTFGYCSWNSNKEFIIGLIMICICCCILLLVKRFSIQSRLVIDEYLSGISGSTIHLQIFVVFAGAFSFTYFLGTNWYYRLIFLIPIALVSNTSKTQLGNMISISILVASFSFAGNVLYLHLLGQITVTALVAIFVVLLGLLVSNKVKTLKDDTSAV